MVGVVHVCVFNCSVVSDSFVTPWTVTHQAPLSMGFPREEYCSGLPLEELYSNLHHQVVTHLIKDKKVLKGGDLVSTEGPVGQVDVAYQQSQLPDQQQNGMNCMKAWRLL